MNKRQRLQWLLYGNIPPKSPAETIRRIYEDLGFCRMNPKKRGSHCAYVREIDDEKIAKTYPVVSGRYVKKEYVLVLRDNAFKVIEAIGGMT
jgi:hypothetical protein